MDKIDLKQVGVFVVAGLLGGFIALSGFQYLSQKSGSDTLAMQVEEESATVTTVKRMLPSVVAIMTEEDVRSVFGKVYRAQGGGSGFIVREDGLIVTNRHVVSSEDAKYTVVTNDGKDYDATVVARDSIADLALLKISAQGLSVVEMGDSDKLELGQKVIAIGNALGEYTNSVTTGVVSGIGRVIVAGDGLGDSERLEGVIQTDAAINPGNSGGPLLNLAGQVIGINVAVDQQGTSIGFAIPINSVKQAIASVVANGEIVRPKLGVRYVVLDKETAEENGLSVSEGAWVTGGDSENEPAVEPGSAAEVAGVQAKDVIVAINDTKLTAQRSLASVLQQYKPGDVVRLKLVRGEKELFVEVTLGKL